MVVKIYVSGISGNKEVKKRQQRVLMILDSKNIKYEVIDITEPGREADKDFMQNNAKSSGGTVSDPSPRSPLPPQMFNAEEYCGDYDQFDLANEIDTLEQFLKLEVPPEEPPQAEPEEKTLNGEVNSEKSKETSQERETTDDNKPEDAEEKQSASKEDSPAKEGSVPKEDGTIPTEASPDKENVESTNEETKEELPERQKSVEKETTEKEESPVKENSPEKEEQVNENGAVSSREQSEEKEADDQPADSVERKKENPSELLIENEQATAVAAAAE